MADYFLATVWLCRVLTNESIRRMTMIQSSESQSCYSDLLRPDCPGLVTLPWWPPIGNIMN